MREIKFRGKRTVLGQSSWIYGYGAIDNEILTLDFAKGIVRVECDPDTVGQYIPKEGFYEGDILYGEERNEYGTLLSVWYGLVKYDESTGRIRIEDDCGDWYETDDFAYNKVIGNIHDNVGLLQKITQNYSPSCSCTPKLDKNMAKR